MYVICLLSNSMFGVIGSQFKVVNFLLATTITIESIFCMVLTPKISFRSPTCNFLPIHKLSWLSKLSFSKIIFYLPSLQQRGMFAFVFSVGVILSPHDLKKIEYIFRTTLSISTTKKIPWASNIHHLSFFETKKITHCI